ncbi:MAG: hypothetical protein AB4426_32225 [Xenococcaceae cyanobacterium]
MKGTRAYYVAAPQSAQRQKACMQKAKVTPDLKVGACIQNNTFFQNSEYGEKQ